VIPRRRLLEIFAGCASALSLSGAARSDALPVTPAQTPGPFYPLAFPVDSDNDLVQIAGHSGTAKGTVTYVAGRILNAAGRPVSGARVEIWQCDVNGRYHYVNDRGTNRPLDENFQGYGRTVTDAAGNYGFRTIRPVPYPGRTPHIHFAISDAGLPRFTTQMYVAGEPLNERDGVLMGIHDLAARARVIVPLRPAPEAEPDALAGTFDIVLGQAGNA
jgi:protocatechuate 3,4-dioxygenase beta subunit